MRARERVVLLLTMASLTFGCPPEESDDKSGGEDGGVQDERDGSQDTMNETDPDAGMTGTDAGADAGGEPDADVDMDDEDEGPGACEVVTTPVRLVSDVDGMWSLPQIDGDYVYYSDSATIHRVSKCGGASESIVTADKSISVFDVHDGVLYFPDGDGIATAPAQPNSTKTPLLASTTAIGQLDVTEQGVFWSETDQNNTRIRRADLDGGNILTLFEGASVSVGQLTAEGAHVYWLSSGLVISRVGNATASATATKVLELPGGAVAFMERFAVDATQVYATDDLTNKSTSLWRAPNDGSAPDGIALAYIFSSNTSAVAVRSKTVYFSTRNSTSRIYKIGATADFGTTPTQLGMSKRVTHLLVDAHDLFIRAGDGPYHLERLSR